jgi:hypothetical protein
MEGRYPTLYMNHFFHVKNGRPGVKNTRPDVKSEWAPRFEVLMSAQVCFMDERPAVNIHFAPSLMSGIGGQV